MAAVDEIAVGVNNDDVGDGVGIRGATGQRVCGERGEKDSGKGGIVFAEVGEGLLGGIIKGDEDDLHVVVSNHGGVLFHNFGSDGAAGCAPRGGEEVHVILRLSIRLMSREERGILDGLSKRSGSGDGRSRGGILREKRACSERGSCKGCK